MRLPRLSFVILVAVALSACQSQPRRESNAASGSNPRSAQALVGDYDSYAQSLAGSARWQISLQPLPKENWLLWTAKVDSGRSRTLSLPMQASRVGDGTLILVPHVSGDATARLDADFDPKQWRALDACALRSQASMSSPSYLADRAACATVAPALGESAALLPVGVTSTSTGLVVRSFADQSVDPARSIVAARVRRFEAWAAILGAGAQASAGSSDWHMNRQLRVGSEGDRVAVNWRDGQASGYSLQLERIAVQGGQVPLLKLSILDNKRQVIAYAWAAPESDRIGINLGWIQVGLEATAVRAPMP